MAWLIQFLIALQYWVFNMDFMKKIVVYSEKSPSASFVMKGVNHDVAETVCLAMKKDFFSKLFFKIFFYLHLYKIAVLFRFEKNIRMKIKSGKIQKVIFFDCVLLKEYFVLDTLMKKKQGKYIYFWNPIKYRQSNENKAKFLLKKLEKMGFVLKTFDLEDSKRYQIAFLKSPNRRISFNQKRKIVDFYFAGLPKGRECFLETMKEELLKKNFSSKFILVRGKKDYISQEENRINSENCRCIVDLVSDAYGQANLSLRSTDALFLEKKVITNCEAVVDADFYNPANIFLIRNMSLDGIENFMNRPYEKISENIVNSYEINNWLKNNF